LSFRAQAFIGTQLSSRNTGEQLHSASGSNVKNSDFQWNRPEDKLGPSKARTPQDITKLKEWGTSWVKPKEFGADA
jgi:hypothetical protein